ncbi:unnamed protein product, partial [Closterium sp. NIES-64]
AAWAALMPMHACSTALTCHLNFPSPPPPHLCIGTLTHAALVQLIAVLPEVRKHLGK